MLSLLLITMGFVSRGQAHPCAHCGCEATCQKTCRLVCEEKKVEVFCFGCKCEDFCVPCRSCQGCEHSETVCDECMASDQCDACDQNVPHSEPKGFVWFDWFPGGAKIYTRTKLMRKSEFVTVPSYKWVTEDLCPQCAAKVAESESARIARQPDDAKSSTLR